MSLKARISITFLLFMLLVISILGMFGAGKIFDAYINQQKIDLFHSFQIEFEKINRHVSQAIENVLLINEQEDFLELSAKGFKPGQTPPLVALLFQEAFRYNPTFFKLRFLDKEGNEVIEFIRPNIGEPGYFSDERILQNQGNRDYFLQAKALKSGQVYVSPLGLNREAGKVEQPHNPVLRIAGPTYVDGELEGVLVLNIFMKGILANLAETNQKHVTDFFLANGAGNYLFHPEESRAFAYETNQSASTVFKDFFSGYQNQLEKALEKDSSFSHIDADANLIWIKRFFVGDPEHGQITPYYGVTKTDYHTAMYGLVKLRDEYFVYGLGLITLLSLVLLLFLRYLFRPMDRLVESLKEYQDVKQQHIFSEEGPAEVASLARTLNEMSNTLHRQSKDLVQARKKAEELSHSRGAFLSRMSHEIRTPLNGIIGYTHLLKKRYGQSQELPPKAQDFVDKIDRASSLLLRLINNVLDLAKFEAGSMGVSLENFHLGQTVKAVFEINKSKALQKNLEYDLHLDEELSLFYRGDVSKVSQILSNLIGNAIKFTDKGKAVRVSVLAEEGGVLFQVEDEGIGVPEDQLQAIFDPFQQMDTSVQRHYGGTGLGLSIVQHIVEQLDGKITLESEVGLGSRFSVFLPMESVKATAQSEVSRQSLRFTASQKILMADDHPENLEILKEQLADLGLTDVVSAKNGNEAIEQAEKGDFQLIFMDYHMPECNGVEAAQSILEIWKQQEREPSPIVLLTADVSKECREQAQRAGIKDILTKPLEEQALLRVLQKHLDHSLEEPELADREVAGPPKEQAELCLKHLETIAGLPLHQVSKILDILDEMKEVLGKNVNLFFENLKAVEQEALGGNREGLLREVESLHKRLQNTLEEES